MKFITHIKKTQGLTSVIWVLKNICAETNKFVWSVLCNLVLLFNVSCLFVQCWPRIFLVECQENFCNVCAVFTATGYYQKLTRPKQKLPYSDLFRRHWLGFFSRAVSSGAFWATLQRFLSVRYCPKSIKTTLNRSFPCAMFSGASWTTLHKVFTCAMLSRINASLNKIFTCELLSGISRTTSHRVFTCAMLSQEY